jgi:hypothetical protein
MKSKILAHEQTIRQKEDVEDHHATSKEQIQELLEQKQTL